MKRIKLIPIICGIVIAIVGGVFAYLTKASGQNLPFALSLILSIAGIVLAVLGFLPARQPTDTRTLALAALFTALCYIGFTYCKIDIPVGAEKTAFHLGNVFCVLAALLLGGFWGGMAGAVGMTLADLTTAYVTSAPKTFVLKLCIGLLVGFVGHKLFRISKEENRKVPLSVATILSCCAGMGFNMIADPLLGYFYKMYVLGVPQDAANVWAKIGAITTSVNAVVAVIAATIFYLALRPALKRTHLLPKL